MRLPWSGSGATLTSRCPNDSAAEPARSSRREEALTSKPGKEVSLLTSAATIRLREVEMRDFAALHLPSLPGTARESAALTAQAQQWNWPIAVFEGGEANQTRLREVSSPRIHH